MMEYIFIQSYLMKSEADLVSIFLESHGIQALVKTDDCGGQRPFMAYGSSIRLEVKSTDFEAAQALLKQFHS